MENKETNPYEGLSIRELYEEAKKQKRPQQIATMWGIGKGQTKKDADKKFAMEWVRILNEEGHHDLADAIEQKAEEEFNKKDEA